MGRSVMSRSMAVSTVLLTALASVACVQQTSTRPELPPGAVSSADKLLVVDCLLPGQVRKLGSQMTYLTARRPVQTTVQDCEIRGGEYVAYDRATYAAALRIWLPLAEQGDADAQNRLGEIYERGLGAGPDYSQAAAWYRRAAEQGLEKAQINLGFMYEKGRGVPRDPALALEWYRKASKLPDAVMIDRADLEQQQAELAKLREELSGSRDELERARRDWQQQRERLELERQRLRQEMQRQRTSGTEVDPATRQRLEAARQALQRQGMELARRQERIQSLESTSRQQRERLLLMEAEGESLREQLALVRGELQRSAEQLARYQAEAGEKARLLAQTQARLAALGPASDPQAQERIAALQTELARREQALEAQQLQVAQLERKASEMDRRVNEAVATDRASREQDARMLAQTRDQLAQARAQAAEQSAALAQAQAALAAQQARQQEADREIADLRAQLQTQSAALAEHQTLVADLRAESEQWQEKLKQLETEQATASAAGQVARAGADSLPTSAPVIELIEPPLLTTRSTELTVPVKAGLNRRTLVGRVVAPAGLFALTVNGMKASLDPQGLFESNIELTGAVTPVNLVAVDKQGRRSKLVFDLVRSAAEGSQQIEARRSNPLEGIEIGNYHALVIGNTEYAHLPDLDTAGNDAEEVARVLRERFGYKVTLLRNATRYETLSAFNKLRKELTETDNLLVYYAGHGELDRVNLRGHWLPVDAEPHSSANWISNVSITDILNAMSVRHVLMVADSCYSGALTRSALAQLDSGQTAETRAHWLKTLTKMRSRTALTSGGLAPVLDGGGGNHSVFARAFLSVLRDLDDVAEGQRVYRAVSARVAFEANRYQVEQVPEYAPIKFSGHESGDYLFIPKELRS